MDFKIEVEVSVEMKVIWLRKQDLHSAVWTLQSRAVGLKRYLRGNLEAIAALDRLEQIAAEISGAISEGDIDKVTRLAEEASKQKSVVARVMSEAQNITDEARQFFLDMADAIRALGGY
jgi:hypothetical protein